MEYPSEALVPHARLRGRQINAQDESNLSTSRSTNGRIIRGLGPWVVLGHDVLVLEIAGHIRQLSRFATLT